MQEEWSSIAGVNHGQGARNSSCKGSGVAKLGLIMGRELGILHARGVE